ncbi:MAG: site-specific integrase [Kiritimatiellaeota bacterium]|nr:site-specific integrase [Kiritimatiellota bacterium]
MGEIAESSYAEYKMTTILILQHLGQLADKPMDAVERRDAMSFRDALVKRVSPATANKRIKIARVIWGSARRDGVVQDNPFTKVEGLKVERSQRRPFTMPEMKAVLNACDTEWKGIVLMGLYTGQRLGDITNLRWRQIDFEQKTISFVTRKTDRSTLLPMHKVLYRFLLALPSADDPSAAVYPKAVSKGTNTLSREFGEILHKAGLIVLDKLQRLHEGQGKGRNTRRNVGGLSFHCLRHTASSLLKNAGASDVVAREIIGHDSEAVSRRYTHIEPDTLRAAVAKMPDVTS